ncbi:hypothetical protein PYW08_011396 [Mythimna loreyi]|uniref:Uncharacterized protein n=1 Tax=Mythimna loreyi TaxID=667449 RepID=A0ACC2Q429_9NEOP|nr:hypothetical protein PYW08_011396 [Mythimna loreyi]
MISDFNLIIFLVDSVVKYSILYTISNIYIFNIIQYNIQLKLKGNCLSWYGHVKRRDETHVTKRVLSLNVDGWRGRGRPKKRWMDCVRSDMKEKGVSDSLTGDRTGWKKKTCCADPK